MKLRDTFFIFLTVFVFGVALYFFIQPEQEVVNVENQEVMAVVEGISGQIKRRPVNGVGWLNMQKGENLYDGDTLVAFEESYAQVSFPGKTKINLTPNSFLHLRKNGKTTNVELKKGFLGVNLSDEEETVGLKLGNKLVELSSSKAKIHISLKDNGKTQVTIVDGKAKVKLSDKEVDLRKGQKIEVDENSNKLAVSSFGIIPSNPDSGAVFYKEYSKKVDLSWNSKNPAKEYTIIAARDAKLKKIVDSKTVQGQSVELDIPDEGRYFWKVEGLMMDDSTTEAPVSTFQVKSDVAPRPLSPSNMGVIGLKSKEVNTSVTLRWEDQTNSNYEVEFITISGQAGKMIKSEDAALTINSLERKNYKWRVRVVSDDRPASPWSDTWEFIIEDLSSDESLGPGGLRRREIFDAESEKWKKFKK